MKPHRKQRFQIEKCIVVASYPRSGTHLAIDFIRRNFPAFNNRAHLWESASRLYLNADAVSIQALEKTRIPITPAGHVLIKTHQFLELTAFHDLLVKSLSPNFLFYIYPFRRFALTMKSLAEFIGFEGCISQFLGIKDPYFGFSFTVRECAHEHARNWMETNAVFVNTQQLIVEPTRTAGRLAALLDERPVELERRLPRRKPFHGGKISELAQRFTGRESTEVSIRHRLSWQSEEERRYVDAQFTDIFSLMDQRRIN